MAGMIPYGEFQSRGSLVSAYTPKNTPYSPQDAYGNYMYWYLQYNYYGYGQNRGGSAIKKVDPDLTIYYIKESDLYKLYPYSKTNNKKEWEKERDAGNLYTRLDNVINIIKDADDETDILEHYKELREYLSDGKNFKNDNGDENDPTLKAEWKEEVFYDYYEFLNTLIQSKPPASDLIGNSKEEFIQRLKDTYNNFLASYENLVTFEIDEDENTSLDADTLIEYNKIALVLKYPNLTYELASEVQNRNDIYEAYKKVLEKKLKTYQADLDSLNKIATTLTSSTLRTSDTSDEEAARMLNMNRRYQDLSSYYKVSLGSNYNDKLTYYTLDSDGKTYTQYNYTTPDEWDSAITAGLYCSTFDTNGEVQKLLDAIAAAGERYKENIDAINGLSDSFYAYYQELEKDGYSPDKIADLLIDTYNKSELRQTRRIIDKYDDKEEDDIKTQEYKEELNKLTTERNNKEASYQSKLAEITDKINEYVTAQENLQIKIDAIQEQINKYNDNIAEYNQNIIDAEQEILKYNENDKALLQEGQNLIEYLLSYKTIQGNVNFLIEYVEWLNRVADELLDQIRGMFNNVETSKDYAAKLKVLINTYEAELFTFLHRFDALEEDLEDGFNPGGLNDTISGMNQTMDTDDYSLNSYKDIFYLGKELVNSDTLEEDLTNKTNAPLAYNALKEAMITRLLPTKLEKIDFGVIHTHLEEGDKYYLAAIDKNDIDATYYPTPVWLDEINETTADFNNVVAAINAAKTISENTQTGINDIPDKTFGDWVRDFTGGGTYRKCTEFTPYDSETVYYANERGSIYKVSDEEEFNEKKTSLYYYVYDMPVKIFSLDVYSMLYEKFNYIGDLNPTEKTYEITTPTIQYQDNGQPDTDIDGNIRYDTETQDIVIYKPPVDANGRTIAVIAPDSYYTTFDHYLGRIVKSFGELKAYESSLRATYLDYVYAYLTYDVGLRVLLDNTDYAAYEEANAEYKILKAKADQWYSTLTDLNTIWNSGYSTENPRTDKGRQLEVLLQEANTQYNYYSSLATQAKAELDNQYGDLSGVSDMLVDNLVTSTQTYNTAARAIKEPYAEYVKLVNHYLTLLFNTNTNNNMVDKSVSTLTGEYADKYNLGLGPAIINYITYTEADEQNMKTDVLEEKIELFKKLTTENYLLYIPVNCHTESYLISQYSYYQQIGNKFYPYDSYTPLSWPTAGDIYPIYKVSKALEDFVGNKYALVDDQIDPNNIYYSFNSTTSVYNRITDENYSGDKYIYINAEENGGILKFLQMLLQNSGYMQAFKTAYLDSLELYNNLLDRKEGSTDAKDELLASQANLQLQLDEVKKITDLAGHTTINEDEYIDDIRRKLAIFLQKLTVAYVDEVERRYGVI